MNQTTKDFGKISWFSSKGNTFDEAFSMKKTILKKTFRLCIGRRTNFPNSGRLIFFRKKPSSSAIWSFVLKFQFKYTIAKTKFSNMQIYLLNVKVSCWIFFGYSESMETNNCNKNIFFICWPQKLLEPFAIDYPISLPFFIMKIKIVLRH